MQDLGKKTNIFSDYISDNKFYMLIDCIFEISLIFPISYQIVCPLVKFSSFLFLPFHVGIFIKYFSIPLPVFNIYN